MKPLVLKSPKAWMASRAWISLWNYWVKAYSAKGEDSLLAFFPVVEELRGFANDVDQHRAFINELGYAMVARTYRTTIYRDTRRAVPFGHESI
jgi:hypothetical protein